MNLIQIWERAGTFPLPLLDDLRKRLAAPVPAPCKIFSDLPPPQPNLTMNVADVASSTPPGSPPRNLLVSQGLRQPLKKETVSQPGVTAPPPVMAPARPDASSILAALAGLQPMPAATPQGPPQVSAPAPPMPPVQAPPVAAAPPTPDLASLLAGIGQSHQAPPQPLGQQYYGQPYQAPTPVNPPVPIAPPQTYPQFYQPQTPVQQAPPPAPVAANPLGALAGLLPPHVLSNPQTLTEVLNLLQGLQQEGIPQEQWSAVIVALYPPPQSNGVAATTPITWGSAPQDGYQQQQDPYGGYRDRSHERGHGRSRSPDFQSQKSANRRPSPVYGTYDASIAQAQADDQPHFGEKRGRGRGGRSYRQRTPPGARNGHQEMPPVGQVSGPKWTDIDPTLPAGHIKVLSRTLFVGGATGSEAELRAIFGRFGQVQTCIANEDKRHAFVKMCTRNDAVSAKTAMETTRDSDILAKARQTKWGVGFGPRECCDYTSGISVIPIDTLTDADHKWMLSAEYGGTGGRPIESGLVVEEPDIEIGAGVSSKGKQPVPSYVRFPC